MEILAESSENHFVAYCPEHEEFQLAWNRLTLHLTAAEFEELQTMFEEIMLDEMMGLLESDGSEWLEPMGDEYEAFDEAYEEDDEDDEDDESDDEEGDEIVLWFEEVALRVTLDEFQELAFLVSEAALVANIQPQSGFSAESGVVLDLALPPLGMSLFSLN